MREEKGVITFSDGILDCFFLILFFNPLPFPFLSEFGQDKRSDAFDYFWQDWVSGIEKP